MTEFYRNYVRISYLYINKYCTHINIYSKRVPARVSKSLPINWLFSLSLFYLVLTPRDELFSSSMLARYDRLDSPLVSLTEIVASLSSPFVKQQRCRREVVDYIDLDTYTRVQLTLNRSQAGERRQAHTSSDDVFTFSWTSLLKYFPMKSKLFLTLLLLVRFTLDSLMDTSVWHMHTYLMHLSLCVRTSLSYRSGPTDQRSMLLCGQWCNSISEDVVVRLEFYIRLSLIFSLFQI